MKWLRKLVASASLFAFIGMALRVGGGMLTLPLALRVLPAEQMGLYYTFMGMTAIASMMDFGFGVTISRNAAYAMGGAVSLSAHGVPEAGASGAPNLELLAQLTTAVRKWYGWMSILLFAALAFGGGWLVEKQLRQMDMPWSLLICWICFAANASYGFMTTYWPDLLMGIGSVRTNALYSIVSQLLGLAVLIAGLSLHFGLWSYVVSSAASSVLGRALCKRAFFRDSGISLVKTRGNPVAPVIRELWPMAWRQGLVMVGAFLVQRGSTLICSNFLGLGETARLGLSLNLLNLIVQISGIPLIMVLPRISSLRIGGGMEDIRRLFFSRTYGGLALAAIGMTCLYAIGPWLLGLLGSKTGLLSPPLLLILCIVLLLESHHVAYCNLVLSQNRNPFVPLAIISGIIVFTACWFGAKWYGVVGLIVSQAVVQLMWANWWPVSLGLISLQKKKRHPSLESSMDAQSN